MILAIDTALIFSVVSVSDEGEVIFAESGTQARSHAEELGPMLDRAIGGRSGFVEGRSGFVEGRSEFVEGHSGSVEKVVVGRGPGSFTGLRVGLVAAQTIGWALSVPVVGVCSLDAIAAAADPDFTGFVVTDARRMELHWAYYVDGYRRDGPEVEERRDVRDRIGTGSVVGDTHLLDESDRRAKGNTQVFAESLGLVASRVDVAGSQDPARPYYLRSPDISPPSAPKSPLPRSAPDDRR